MAPAASCTTDLSHEIPRVHRLLSRLGARQDIDDLRQTVFLEFLRSRSRYRGEGTVSAFISGITVRVIRRARQSAARDLRRRDPREIDGADTAETADRRPGPEAQSLARERVRRAVNALEKISGEKRTAFLMWAIEGKAPAEIAKITNASVSATRSRIFYAQKELRASASADPYLSDLVA
jgi:RNA polymerase sigma-70 factor (ECF subfamily)